MKLPKIHLRDLIWVVLVAALLIDRVTLLRRLDSTSSEVQRLGNALKMADFVKSRWTESATQETVEGFEGRIRDASESKVRFRVAP